MKDQIPLGSKLASEGLARKFGDWCRDAALDHQAGGQEIHDFMAHPDSANQFHRLINEMALKRQVSRPLRERRPRFSPTLGTFKSKTDLVRSVEEKGHQISVEAKQVVDGEKFVLLGTPERYDFFKTTVKELTGADRVTTRELYVARDQLGYCDAPDESALVIRMEYTDQPMGEWRSVLSEPRADADGSLRVFYLARFSGGSFVGGRYADPDHVWSGDKALLVCRKCQPLAI